MIISPARRIRKAYGVAFVVFVSYYWLSFRRRFMGWKWYERRITALHIRNAERVKTAILELEGLFIKMRQLLSVMSNFSASRGLPVYLPRNSMPSAALVDNSGKTRQGRKDSGAAGASVIG